jgi:RNA polymerase sigma-70 factor (ECF subfamily)
VSDIAIEVKTGWELVAAVQRGDREAFGELYNRYQDKIRRYLTLRVPDHELVEDLTSETFLRALTRIDSVRYQGRDVGVWLITIARNLMRDHHKRSATRCEFHRAELPDIAADSEGPEQLVLTALDRQAIRVALTDIVPKQRECIRLRFERDLSIQETSVEMNSNVGAIKALQHRAVRALATRVGPMVAEVA